jgi:tetratricopeptide (TPR) repeat protein
MLDGSNFEATGAPPFPRSLREFAFSSDQTDLARAHNNLGALLMQRKQPTEAISQFDAALRIDPNEQNSLIGRRTIEYQQGALDAALQDFVRAAQISASPVTYFWMGRVLEEKGLFPEAVVAYTGALQMAPDMQEAQTRLDAMKQNIH